MRNIAGVLAQRKTTRAIISALSVLGKTYSYLDSESEKWLDKPENDADVELRVKGLSWVSESKPRVLLYNIKVPVVNKNVDLCLFNSEPVRFLTYQSARSSYQINNSYLALGELKGGIDPQALMNTGRQLAHLSNELAGHLTTTLFLHIYSLLVPRLRKIWQMKYGLNWKMAIWEMRPILPTMRKCLRCVSGCVSCK